MKHINLKSLTIAAAVGFFTISGGTLIATAQSDREMRQQEKIRKQEAKLEQQKAKLAAQRQSDWERRNRDIRAPRNSGSGYYTLETDSQIASGRYRVNREGRWYNTDNRGAELLRNAVSEGYRQGFNAGRANMNNRRNISWNDSSVYRSGTLGYSNGVDRGQYQYYFRQGFQRGYQDGSNRQYENRNDGTFQYGMYQNGQPSILGSILNQVLNIQNY